MDAGVKGDRVHQTGAHCLLTHALDHFGERLAVHISLAHSTDIVEPHAVPGTSKELALMECSAIDGPTGSVALGRGAATRAAKRLFARWECVAYKKTGWKPAFVRPLHRGYW